MHTAKMVCVLLLSIFFITATASAEEHHIRDGFWGGIDAGAGYLSQSLDEGNEDGTSFFLGFKGGYTINPHFLAGLELSGWLIETSDQYCFYAYCSDSSEGEGIMQIFLISRYYPSQEFGFFVKTGGGYDFLLNENVALTPFATFSYGETGNWDYQAITIGLGLTLP